jgi:hypothetical protein
MEDVADKSPAPHASAFCTIGLGGSFNPEHPIMMAAAHIKRSFIPHFQPDWNFVPSETSGVQLKNFSVAASLAACF